ncbi:MAG TPA: EFR1 family ferrodoxin [Methanocorpusculum sp.]|nr:EFR1 family ferrodoxin [Methanocorpusculum sp.]
MKTILYYFTGTGNSLAVARAIAERLPETELVPIPMLLLKGETVRVPKDTNIGIVYPLYAMGLPNIVIRFFGILDLSDAGYVFSVVTEGGKYGSPTKQIAALAKQSGHDLDAAWWIQMPDNYIPLSAPPAKTEQKTIREDALRKVAVLVEAVQERRPRHIDLTATGKLLRMVMYKPFMKKIPAFGKKFVVSSNCNGCMVCVDVCPVNNIQVLPKGKKEWLNHCEGCLACLQFCPVEAISCGGKSDERPRYHHPNITAADMKAQKGAAETGRTE